MKEIWKDIPGYYGYQASNLGNIRNKITKNNLKQSYSASTGYLRVHINKTGLCNKNLLVHRIIASTFIPNPSNKPQVNHIDGNKKNNKTNNLEWATCSENIKHSFDVLGKHVHNEKEVLCVETGEIFCSTVSAGKEKNINSMHIAGCCRGDYGRNTAGGYHWKWALANPNSMI